MYVNRVYGILEIIYKMEEGIYNSTIGQGFNKAKERLSNQFNDFFLKFHPESQENIWRLLCPNASHNQEIGKFEIWISVRSALRIEI